MSWPVLCTSPKPSISYSRLPGNTGKKLNLLQHMRCEGLAQTQRKPCVSTIGWHVPKQARWKECWRDWRHRVVSQEPQSIIHIKHSGPHLLFQLMPDPWVLNTNPTCTSWEIASIKSCASLVIFTELDGRFLLYVIIFFLCFKETGNGFLVENDLIVCVCVCVCYSLDHIVVTPLCTNVWHA